MISSVTASPVVQTRIGTDLALETSGSRRGSAASSVAASIDDTTVVSLSSAPPASSSSSSSSSTAAAASAASSNAGAIRSTASSITSSSSAQGLDRFKTVLDYEPADANQDGTVEELERRAYVLEHPSLEPRVSAEATRTYQSVGQSR